MRLAGRGGACGGRDRRPRPVRPFTASRAVRSATSACSTWPGRSVRGEGHTAGRKLPAAPRPSSRGAGSIWVLTVSARVDAHPARQSSPAGPLGHASAPCRALQHFLGGHAVQQGSKVDADLLRFDFRTPVPSMRRRSARSRRWSTSMWWRRCPWQPGSCPWRRPAMPAAMTRLAKVSRRGSHGHHGRRQPRALRRHRCLQHGPDRPGADRGRRERLGGHAADHGCDGAPALDRFRTAERHVRRGGRRPKVPVADVPARLAAVVKELKDLKKSKPAAATAGRSRPTTCWRVPSRLAGRGWWWPTWAPATPARMRQAIDLFRRQGQPDRRAPGRGRGRQGHARGRDLQGARGPWPLGGQLDPRRATVVGGKGAAVRTWPSRRQTRGQAPRVRHRERLQRGSETMLLG